MNANSANSPSLWFGTTHEFLVYDPEPDEVEGRWSLHQRLTSRDSVWVGELCSLEEEYVIELVEILMGSSVSQNGFRVTHRPDVGATYVLLERGPRDDSRIPQ